MKKLFFLFLAIFIFFIIKNLIYQYMHYNAAKEKEGLDKVKAYEKVVLSYVPLSPIGSKAVSDLYLYCYTFQNNHEKLYCLETLRASIYQIQNPITRPYIDYLEKVNPEIAKLRALESINWEFNNYKMEDYDKLYKAQMEILTYDNKPSDFWSFVVIISLLGWISSVLLLILRSYSKKHILLYFGMFLLFFTLWVAGLYKA